MKEKINHKHKVITTSAIVLVVLFVFASYSWLPHLMAKDYSLSESLTASVATSSSENKEEKKEDPSHVSHVKIPSAVKAIYMTACVAGTTDFRQDLVDLIDQTEINSIIIDIKDFSGTISYETGKNLAGESGSGCKSSDMKEFVKTLHEKGIYVIGRVTVFQDPFYTKIRPDLAVQKASDGSVWKDFKGISFMDVSSKEYWDYILELAEASYQNGFDEINFDYIRFPSDGPMKDIHFPQSSEILSENGTLGKQIALEKFFSYLREKVNKINENAIDEGREPLIISADLFGMVTTNYDDLNIGQVLERALPYFDYVAPMVYPSHYPSHFNNWADPNKVPYELIHYVMNAAVDRANILKSATTTPEHVRDFVNKDQLRPWIQDFDYGGNYGPAEVKAQIQASNDVGLDSWMLWAPSNRYTVEALKSE